jgi:hypothetical protein
MFIRANELAPETRRFVNDYNVLLYEPDGYDLSGSQRLAFKQTHHFI